MTKAFLFAAGGYFLLKSTSAFQATSPAAVRSPLVRLHSSVASVVSVGEDAARDVESMDMWATNVGIQRDGCDLTATYEDDGYGGMTEDWSLVTSQPISAGSPVLFVPADAILSSGIIRNELYTFLSSAEAILAEYERGEMSSYYYWLNSLPRKFNNGAAMTYSCFECLLPYAAQLAETERNTFSKFREALDMVLVTGFIDKKTRSNMNVLKWAFNVVATRSFVVWEGERMIVPMGDFFNHGTEPEVTIDHDEDGNCVFYSASDIPAGYPLRINGDEETKQSFHNQYWEYTLQTIREHVDQTLQDLYALSVRASEKDVVTHPRLPVILKHNEFVTNAFYSVRDQLNQINRYTSFKLDPNYNTTDSSFERPDCIVLDVRLGGEMDGIELLNIIRSDVLLESLPVILLTAKGKVDDRIAGYEAGADAYLTKPFDPEELLSVLQGVLRRDVIVSSRSDDQRESSADSTDSMMPMKEIKREIEEIKSLLRQRNNRPESTISDSSALLDGSDAERPSFASMYKDLIEMKEEIKATSNVNVLQPIVDDTAAEQTTIPKVSLEDINEMYFTPDEQKVISLVEKGMTNKEIGEEYMNCSISKVEKIVSSLFKKTGSKRRPQLVTWCKQNLDTEVEQCEDDPKSSRKLNLKEEKEIMDLIGKGFTNNEIVNNLGVSLKDIVTVVDDMLDKAKVSNRTELMRWWNSKESKTS
ncbi:SET domain-containing protein [Skeletonema marinoi]|uniref:SET domain-containing protein n=1 Tax=Skeletonema marinoi TaxID=267567 RepID=A0AAD9D8D6_9STRA|nr:SET domain-containing protein [Skeletonema marinoi]